MSYGYKPLEKLNGLCKYCVGDCMRLEIFDFPGVSKCTSFEPKEENWYELYRQDFLEKKGSVK